MQREDQGFFQGFLWTWTEAWGVAEDLLDVADILLALVCLLMGVMLTALGMVYWYRRVPPTCLCAIRSQATRLSKTNFYSLHEYLGKLLAGWGAAYVALAFVFFLLPVQELLVFAQLAFFSMVSFFGLVLVVALTIAAERRMHRGSIGMSDMFDL